MQLKRVLTLRTVVATSAGLTLASSSFVAAVSVANYVLGDSSWIAILVGGLLCFLAAACFSELNGLLPTANGIRLYFSRAFNDQASMTISLVYMLVVVLGVVGAESYVISSLLCQIWPAVPPYVWIVLMLLLITGINIKGIKVAGAFQDFITYGLVISMILIGIIALYKVNFHLNTPFTPGSAAGLLQAIAMGVFLYVGFEWVTPLAEEVTHVKQISRGMMIAIGILSVSYAIFTVAMTAVVPKEVLVASAAPQMVFARAALGQAGATWMVIISLAATITTYNAGMLSVSRFMYASAREHVLPAIFSRISMRYFTPWVSILTIFGIGLTISAVTLFTQRYLVLVELAAAMESIVYALIGIAVISLRRRMPDQQRPYLIRYGYLIPILTTLVFAILGAALLASDLWVLAYLTVALLVCLIYVNTVVPYLRRKHQSRRPIARRRPSRAAEGVESK